MRLWLLGALAASLALKGGLCAAGVLPFNADEAVVALMARHILAGARPVFFYGQAYMGSLDAYLGALGYALFGQQVWVLRAVQAVLYLGTLLSTAALGRAVFGSRTAGVVAAWLLAVPAVNVTLYSTVTLGGYGEMLLLGNLILLSALRIAKGSRARDWLLFGFLSGLGLWAFGLTLIYSLAALAFLAWRWAAGRVGAPDLIPLFATPSGAIQKGWGKAVCWVAGGALGAAPWLTYSLRFGPQAPIAELGGAAIAGAEGLPYLAQVAQHTFNFVLLGLPVSFGLRPPWEARLLVAPVGIAALAFWSGVCIYAFHSVRREEGWLAPSGRSLLILVILVLVLGFVLTPFGVDPSGRYFLPLAAPLALFAGDLALLLRNSWGRWAWAPVSMVLAFNLLGTIESAQRFPPGLTTQIDALTRLDHRADDELLAFLRENGEHYGYTNYWVAYPMAFLSHEQLIFIPRLPYHLDLRYTRRDDRYAPYGEVVGSAGRVAYITTGQAELEARLRSHFRERGVAWREAVIGDYRVFYHLSQIVRPEEIGF